MEHKSLKRNRNDSARPPPRRACSTAEAVGCLLMISAALPCPAASLSLRKVRSWAACDSSSPEEKGACRLGALVGVPQGARGAVAAAEEHRPGRITVRGGAGDPRRPETVVDILPAERGA